MLFELGGLCFFLFWLVLGARKRIANQLRLELILKFGVKFKERRTLGVLSKISFHKIEVCSRHGGLRGLCSLLAIDCGEEADRRDGCLVANRDVELGLRRHGVREEFDLLDDREHGVARLHCVRRARQPSLDLARVQLRDAHADSVALPRKLDWLSEHLHRFDFLLGFQVRQLDGIANFHLAAEDCARHDRSLALDLEAVVDRKLEVLVLILTIWDFNIHQNGLDQVFDTVRVDRHRLLLLCILITFFCFLVSGCLLFASLGACFRGGSDGHDWEERAESRMLEACSQLLHLLLQGRVVDAAIREQVHFVQRNNQFVHQDLTEYDAFGRLRLDELLGVNDEHHEINDACATNNRLHETGVTWTVDQCELQVLVLLQLLFVLFSEPFGYCDYECREAEIKGDATLFRLWVLVEAGC